ncbi:MAG TPA: dipeptidase [Blastocatellia bacterium]|jgi:membrane dipeptidase|nr:dipeptidase [Blastocatellia bacterium]
MTKLSLGLLAAFCFVALGVRSFGLADARPTPAPSEQAAKPKTAQDDAGLRARAEKLHREAIVIDTHNDITSPLADEGFDLAMSGIEPNGKIKTHTDIRRMKAGGLDAEFFAVYVGKEFVNKKPSEGGGAARRALDVIDIVNEQVRRHPETFEMAGTADDVRRVAKKGKIAALMGIEGGHAIEDSLRTLRMFYKLGVRYMTLTHTNTNDWADSSGDIEDPNVKHHNGLTDFGREVVREMNRIGMMVDISHVSDKTFYDVVETSRAPVIASHSSARALADHPRNMTDDMLRAIAKNGGVVMVNFFDAFIDRRKAELGKRANARREELVKQFPNEPKRVAEEMEKWRAANDLGRTPLSVLIDHIDHIAKTAGIDHVGIGSDFDGVPLTGVPEGMEDISKLPNITVELMRRGYSDADIKKVLGENFLRVMSAVERTASEMQSGVAAKK